MVDGREWCLGFKDIRTCPYLDTVPFVLDSATSHMKYGTQISDCSKGMEDARGIMVAAIKSAGKDVFFLVSLLDFDVLRLKFWSHFLWRYAG